MKHHSYVTIKNLAAPIILEADAANWPTLEINAKQLVRVYQPIISGPVNRSTNPTIDLQTIFSITNSNGNTTNISGLRFLPNLDAEGEQPTATFFSSEIFDGTASIFPANTIVFETRSHTDETNVFAGFVRNFRRATRQVWLNRIGNVLELPDTIRYGLDVERNAESPVRSIEVKFGFSGIYRASFQHWEEAWKNAETSYAPVPFDFVQDAHFSMYMGNFSDFVLRAAIAIEVLKYHLWDTLYASHRCEAKDQKSANNDTKKIHRYFSEVLKDITGISLLASDPKTHYTIKKCWELRGLIAHGKHDKCAALIKEEEKDNFQFELVEALYSLSEFVQTAVSERS
ncbi:hypothetical protein [Ruegeria sp. HKCCA0235A]|uniref:hypothetical protein n=1 Tax=Ruegeria sp. HKCCA0235A TaxID=2682998 RepID=UPI001487F5DA|nr:hypothetical protein [Ruegeria sp. HKCCA0235A]